MSEEILHVTNTYVLDINRLGSLGVDLANVEGAVLETSVEVLDVAHHPGHLDAALDDELATGLHLPASARASR